MNRIAFTRLRATHFKVYADVSFDFVHMGPGCHAIRGQNNVQPRLGSNGAGKSHAVGRLAFALTGRTTKRLRSSDVQTYGTDNDPVVQLDLEIDGIAHSITRHAVPHRLELDGKPVLQEHLDQLTGLDLDLLLQTVILAQGTPLFLDLEPRNKLSLLSDVLHLDRFDGYAKAAQESAAALKDQIWRLTQRREKLLGSIAEVGRQMNTLRTQAEDWQLSKQDEIKALRAQLHAATAVATKAQAAVQEAGQHYDAVAKDANKPRDALIRAETRRGSAVKLAGAAAGHEDRSATARTVASR